MLDGARDGGARRRLGLGASIGLISEQNSLATAQRQGSDSVEVLSAANVLLSRAQGDLSLTLVNRGTDATDPDDFARGQARCSTTSGLGRPASDAELPPSLPEALTKRIQDLENSGQLGPAIALEPSASSDLRRA